MEESRYFKEDELDLYCVLIAEKLYREGKDYEKILTFSKRGLKFMLSEIGKASNSKLPCIRDEKADYSSINVVVDVDGSVSSNVTSNYYHHANDFMIPNFLNMLGTICGGLGRLNEGGSYYNWADRNLTKLVEKDCPHGCFLRMLEKANRGLFMVKRGTGRMEEGISHVEKVLECKEKMLEEGCVEIGQANKDVYEAYFDVVDFKEALPFCLKALEIHKKHFGGESVEVANMESSLGSIYGGLREYEKSLEQARLAKSILKKVAPDSLDLIQMELRDGITLRKFGRYEKAIDVYKSVLSHAASEIDRAWAFCGMANASFGLKKLTDMKKHIRAAQRIFEKKEMDPLIAAVGFEEISRTYEKMNDLENSILFIRRVPEVPKLPEKLLVESCSRLLLLYSLAIKEDEGIPYMEDAVEKRKESFGLGHYEVGRGYGMLGRAYMILIRDELGLKALEKAKEILEASCGPDHMDSLTTSHHLALIYSRMQRMELAIKIEEEVVAGCKRLGSSGEKLMGKVVGQLNKFMALSVDLP